MPTQFKPLPECVKEICNSVDAPPRLVAHLTLVHDVACDLVVAFQARFPDVVFNSEEILFGAAVHDIGKAVCREELIGQGESHQRKGFDLLKSLGISDRGARFALTHGNWQEDPDLTIEDLMVALADKCWKGKRVPDLETKIGDEIVRRSGKDRWDVFLLLDDIVERLAADGDKRLAWQAQFPT